MIDLVVRAVGWSPWPVVFAVLAGSWEVFGELSGIEVLSVQHLGHRRPDCGIIAGR